MNNLSKHISRRKFIARSSGAVLSFSSLFSGSAFAAGLVPRSTSNSKILVLVQLAGGNDGLNTVVPYGSTEYYQARPNLAIKPDEVLPLTNQIGLHPSLSALKDLYQEGKLAIIQGVGYPNQSRSHFRANEIWQTAAPEKSDVSTWLERYITISCKRATMVPDAASGYTTFRFDNLPAFPAINVDPFSNQIWTHTLSSENQYRFNTEIHYQLGGRAKREAGSLPYKLPLRLNESGNALESIDHDIPWERGQYGAPAACRQIGQCDALPLHFTRFDGMKLISKMILAGSDTPIYHISFGGFDTHANQLPKHAHLLKQLSESLAAFQKDLETHNLDRNVIVLIFSEFGRSLHENQDLGTDHGTAQPVLILGNSVKGGLYGDHTDLTDLNQDNLKHKIDFRTIYATIFDRWLDIDSRRILGNQYNNLEFV